MADTNSKPNPWEKLVGFFSAKKAAEFQYYRDVAAYNQQIKAGTYHTQSNTTRLSGSSGPQTSGQTGLASMYAALANERVKLIQRARHLDRNNWLASSLLTGSTNWTIGGGDRIKPNTASDELNKLQADAWSRFWLGTPELSGRLQGPELQRYLWRARNRDGGICLIMWGNGKLQVMHADWLRTPRDVKKYTSNAVVDGIEINKAGRPLYYFFGDDFNGTTTRVPAKNVIHYSRMEDFDSMHGVPVFSKSFDLFSQIDGYIDSTIVASRMAASYGLVIKKAPTSQTPYSLGTVKDSAGNDRPLEHIETGMVRRIGTDESIEQIKPEQPNINFDAFMTALSRFVSIPLNIPLEIAMMSFRANFSASRGAVALATRAATTDRETMCAQTMCRIYNWKMANIIRGTHASGLPDNDTARLQSLAAKVPEPWKHIVMPDPVPSLDPQKDALTDLIMTDAGHQTMRQYCFRHGLDYEAHIDELALELAERSKRGLNLARASQTRDEVRTDAAPKENTPPMDQPAGDE